MSPAKDTVPGSDENIKANCDSFGIRTNDVNALPNADPLADYPNLCNRIPDRVRFQLAINNSYPERKK
ncbi:unnamed protein product [Rotaria sp. Silwood2]|nr:unnamed protein product [Rotaria sp. Silwood2]CAF4468424.1 unnamed protein product [Rotaria sp. Silwood2]